MDKLEEITADGVAVCQPGLRLGALETEARKQGWELRMYPSTLVKASVGGFLAGGSGGIGSVRTAVCATSTRCAHLKWSRWKTSRAWCCTRARGARDSACVGHQRRAHAHLVCAAPAVEWTQVTAAFDTYDRRSALPNRLRRMLRAWTKRLATVFEWPIPSFFTPVKQVVREGKALALIMIATAQADALRGRSEDSGGGEVTFTGSIRWARTQPLLSDYTWNHTTLWAMKADPAYTYLQCGFSRRSAEEQFRLLRERYGTRFCFTYRVHEERRRRRDSGRDPGGALHNGGAVERHDCLLPIDWRVCRQPACELPGRRRAASRRQYSIAGEAEVRSARPAESRQDDQLSQAGGDPMKTWIPDARNFAYLTWKQVDALPRESTLLVLPTAAIEQHGHHLPLATDTLINNLVLGKALALVPGGVADLCAAAGLLWQEQRAYWISGTLSVSAQRFWRWCATWARALRRRIQEGCSLQHAWREHIAGRCAGARSARGVWPADLFAVRLAGRDV
jgi:hypothetical protein